ncbi:MAG: restriction endonuclease subunit S [Microthrixaceae bacterium]
MSDDIDLPSGWMLVTTGDVAQVVGGGTPKTSVAGNFIDDGGHPWITPADLSGYTDKYISRGKRNLTDQGLATSSAKYMPAGTVLYSTRAPIGYVAIAANAVTTNQGFRSFVPSPSVDPEYLYYGLKLARGEAEQLASGTTFAELSGTNAKKLHLPLAPLDVQRQIVKLLDETNSCNASARQHLAVARRAIERFRQAVLTAAFSGRLTFDWHELSSEPTTRDVARLASARVDAWAKTHGTRKYTEPVATQASDLPDIPETWTWLSADAACVQITDGEHIQPPYQSTGFPMLSAKHVRDGFVDPAGAGLISDQDLRKALQRCAPAKNDLLIVSVGATTGRSAIVETSEKFAIVRSVLLMRPLVDSKYMLRWLQHPWTFRWMTEASGASAQPHLYIRDLKRMPVPLPPAGEQAEIVRRVDLLFAAADRLGERLQAATASVERTSQAVLAKAFRGESVGA